MLSVSRYLVKARGRSNKVNIKRNQVLGRLNVFSVQSLAIPPNKLPRTPNTTNIHPFIWPKVFGLNPLSATAQITSNCAAPRTMW